MRPVLMFAFASFLFASLHLSMAQSSSAPWRALYRGTVGGEALWLDLMSVPDRTSPSLADDASATPWSSVETLRARLLLPERGAVLFGEGTGARDGGVRLRLLDDTGGRGAAGARGAPGTVVGTFEGLRSMAANDDGRRLEGTLDIGGRTWRMAARRAATYAYLRFDLGPVSASLAVPDFQDGPWQSVSEEVWRDQVATLRSFAVDGRAQYREGEVFHGWTQAAETTVQGASSRYLSLLTAASYYTGGAHGNLAYQARTFVAAPDGPRAVELEALLRPGPGGLGTLAAYVLDDLHRQGATWVVTGDVTELDATDLALYALTPVGLQFVFPPYAMGSYAEGTYTTIVPYEIAAASAPADGLLAELASDARRR